LGWRRVAVVLRQWLHATWGTAPKEEIMGRLHDRIGLGSVITVGSLGLGMLAASVQMH
jgi:hypothetical protein